MTPAQKRRSGRGQGGGSSGSRAKSVQLSSARIPALPMLRTSERGSFKRCRWKWWLEFEENIKPAVAAPPLRFGSLIHGALAAYYKPGVNRGPSPVASFRRLYAAEAKEMESFGFKVSDVEDNEKWIEAGELGEAMLKGYVEKYGKDDEWEVLVTEHPFQQLVYRPGSYDPNHPPAAQEGAEPWFIYTGVLDGIWRNRRTKKISIVDHKTAKTINVEYLSLDIQASAYWTWGLDWIYESGLLKLSQKPAGMLYNHLRKAFPDNRPKDRKGYALNNDGSVSKRQPSPLFVRTPIWRDPSERDRARVQAEAEFADMEAIRNEGERDGTSEPPDSAYKNNSQWTCPGCWAFDICELHEIGQDWRGMRDATTQKWDPYAEHEVYEGR